MKPTAMNPNDRYGDPSAYCRKCFRTMANCQCVPAQVEAIRKATAKVAASKESAMEFLMNAEIIQKPTPMNKALEEQLYFYLGELIHKFGQSKAWDYRNALAAKINAIYVLLDIDKKVNLWGDGLLQEEKK